MNAGEDETIDTAPVWQEAPENPESEMLRKLEAETIRRMMADLPEAFREVIVLREFEDLSYREIAKVVDAPLGTVMSRLARGRVLLRKAWLEATCEAEPQQQQIRMGNFKERLQ